MRAARHTLCAFALLLVACSSSQEGGGGGSDFGPSFDTGAADKGGPSSDDGTPADSDKPRDPGAVDPGAGDPGAGDPGAGDPGVGDPGPGDPGAGDPGVGDITQVDGADPGAVDTPSPDLPEEVTAADAADGGEDTLDDLAADTAGTDPGAGDPGPSDPGPDPCACAFPAPICVVISIPPQDYGCFEAANCQLPQLDPLKEYDPQTGEGQFCKGTCASTNDCKGEPTCQCAAHELNPQGACDPSTDPPTSYDSICDLRKANSCQSLDDLFTSKGAYPGFCKGQGGCECPNVVQEVCGTDQLTYDSQCHLQKCSDSVPAPTLCHGGPCFDFSQTGCEGCQETCGQYFSLVCDMTSNTTLPNDCAALCIGLAQDDIVKGQCCACNPNDLAAVCGSDGKTYTNDCFLTCTTIATGGAVLKASDGPCSCECTPGGDPVCGFVGTKPMTFENLCFANCVNAQNVKSGTCAWSDCDCQNLFQPICGTDGVTYPNACTAECAGATVASTGLCSSCKQQLICPGFSPVCGNDGVTYPDQKYLTFQCVAGNATIDATGSKEPCPNCAEDTDCSDLDPCTADTCTVAGKCQYTVIPGCTDPSPWDPAPGCQ